MLYLVPLDFLLLKHVEILIFVKKGRVLRLFESVVERGVNVVALPLEDEWQKPNRKVVRQDQSVEGVADLVFQERQESWLCTVLVEAEPILVEDMGLDHMLRPAMGNVGGKDFRR